MATDNNFVLILLNKTSSNEKKRGGVGVEFAPSPNKSIAPNTIMTSFEYNCIHHLSKATRNSVLNVTHEMLP